MHENSEIKLSRDVEAIQIPSGNIITLPAGMTVVVTQSLGGSYTVASPSGLSRITEQNADALGLSREGEKQEIAFTDVDLDPAKQEKAAWEKLKTCFDPEIPVNIVDLGLVYDCQIQPSETPGRGSSIKVQMTLTAPGLRHGAVHRGGCRGQAADDSRRVGSGSRPRVGPAVEPAHDLRGRQDEAGHPLRISCCHLRGIWDCSPPFQRSLPTRFSVMSQHRSLKGASKITVKRNVLKRFERVELMKKRGVFTKGASVIGLPKTKPEA